MTTLDELKVLNAAWHAGVTDYEMGYPCGQNCPVDAYGADWYRAGWRNAASRFKASPVVLRVPLKDAVLLQKAIGRFKGEVGAEEAEKLSRWQDELSEQANVLEEE